MKIFKQLLTALVIASLFSVVLFSGCSYTITYNVTQPAQPKEPEYNFTIPGQIETFPKIHYILDTCITNESFYLLYYSDSIPEPSFYE